jgi:hypothetical protein
VHSVYDDGDDGDDGSLSELVVSTGTGGQDGDCARPTPALVSDGHADTNGSGTHDVPQEEMQASPNSNQLGGVDGDPVGQSQPGPSRGRIGSAPADPESRNRACVSPCRVLHLPLICQCAPDHAVAMV